MDYYFNFGQFASRMANVPPLLPPINENEENHNSYSHMTSSSFSSLREPPNNEGSDSNSSATSISEGSSAFGLESGGSKKGGKNAANNPLISDTEKCRVCEEPAARHIHYGATTCFSCRAFFRRSIQVWKNT